MDLNTLKPDFNCFINKRMYAPGKLEEFHKLWNSIENGVIPYDLKDNDNLKSIFIEYDLESHQNELLFLAHITRQADLEFNIDTKSYYQNRIFEKELLVTLCFLFNHNLDDIKLQLKHKTENQSISVESPKLLQIIKDTLFKEYSDTDDYLSEGVINSENIANWGEYFNIIISDSELLKSTKGRKSSNEYVVYHVEHILAYLELHTEFKSNEDVLLSRKQSAFIHKFLRILNIVTPNPIYESDIIYHLLDSYIKRRRKHYDTYSSLQYDIKEATKIANIKSRLNIIDPESYSQLEILKTNDKLQSLLIDFISLKDKSYSELDLQNIINTNEKIISLLANSASENKKDYSDLSIEDKKKRIKSNIFDNIKKSIFSLSGDDPIEIPEHFLKLLEKLYLEL